MRNSDFRFRGLWHRQFGGSASASTLLYKGQQDFAAGAGQVFTAPFKMIAEVFVWGGGCSGTQGGPGGAGPGSGASMRRWQLSTGQQLQITVGAGGAAANTPANPGGTSTVTGPDAVTIQATGGQLGNVAGVGSGGEYNRTGGVVNAAGQNGGAPGTIAPSGGAPGGGGAAGFSDLFTSPPALAGGRGGDGGSGNGTNGAPGASPGAGGGGGFNALGGKGGDGKVSVVIMQLV